MAVICVIGNVCCYSKNTMVADAKSGESVDKEVEYKDTGYEGARYKDTGYKETVYKGTGYEDTGYDDTEYDDTEDQGEIYKWNTRLGEMIFRFGKYLRMDDASGVGTNITNNINFNTHTYRNGDSNTNSNINPDANIYLYPYDNNSNTPPTFDTVSILDTDILDTDDIVAVERFEFIDNAYGIASCVEDGDQVIRGVLDSVGSDLTVASSYGTTGYSTYWDIYRSNEDMSDIRDQSDTSNIGEMSDMSDISALDMYKEALRYNKVDIITIGYLNNLYDLLTDSEGYELALANLNAVYITGGSLQGKGDCNFNTSSDLLNMSILVTNTLRAMGIYTVYVTNDLAGAINTPPFDGKSAQAFKTLDRDTTPSWDIFTVWVYRNRMDNPHVDLVRSSLYIRPDSSNIFTDGANNESFRVVKLSTDKVIQGLL